MLQCSPPRVTSWTTNGTLTPPALTPDGLIVPSLAVEQLVAAGALLPAPGAVARPLNGYDSGRTEHMALKVKLATLDLDERRQGLVPRSLADTVVHDCLRALRDSWEGWPARTAATMAARLGVDPGRLLAELEAGVKQQLEEIGDPRADWRARPGANKGGSRP
jgi:hypothetical protein